MKQKKAGESSVRRATDLVRAVEIGLECYAAAPPFSPERMPIFLRHVRNTLEIAKVIAEERRPASQRESLESDFFTSWNEATDACVDLFWKRIKEEHLPFVRKDLLRTVLKRGSIRSRNEYDTITDGLVGWLQEGRLTEGEFALLSKLIGEYEDRGE